jgi:hypothetical protein
MHAIEFETQVRNGTVKVILLNSETKKPLTYFLVPVYCFI